MDHTSDRQTTEFNIRVVLLNRIARIGMPETIRVASR